MVEEISGDVACSALYIPPRLSQQGHEVYHELLKAAAASGTETTLAAKLRDKGLMKTAEMRRTKMGVAKTPLPQNAAEIVADAEFNRFYVRAMCRVVAENGGTHVEVYRAQVVADANPEVELGIGRRLDAARLLSDLRNSVDLDAALGLSSGKHSGLSVAPIGAQVAVRAEAV